MLYVRGELSFLRAILACAAVIALGNVATSAADEFQNLDFEDAWIAKPHYSSDLLPGWANDNFEPGYVAYDTISLGSTCISIHDGLSGDYPHMQPLQGQYSVILQSGSLNGTFQHAWISQTGDVPSDARSLMFETDYAGFGGTFAVSMNGTPIPVSLYSVGSVVNPSFGPVETFVGDISTFAGRQDVALRFEVIPPSGLRTGTMDLDAITFSSIVVPEPSALVLLAIGTVSLCTYLLRRRRLSGV